MTYPFPTLTAAAILCVTAAAFAQPASPIADRIAAIAGAHPTVAELSTIGTSGQGRPLHLIRLAKQAEGAKPPDERPAVAIVAGVHPQHAIGIQTALAMADRLIADHAAALEKATVYIIPLLAPDTCAWHLDGSHPAMDFSRTFTPDDADRDARTDEDGPHDVNGDGKVTLMRVQSPAPGSGYEATHMADPDDPRHMREPDRAKGERATHALIVEGRDADGDGRIAEDGPGGVDLDLNFPAHWPEFQSGAGRHQLSEPESLALVRWFLSRPNIIAVEVFAPGDTIVSIPHTGKFDESGQVPTGIEDGDKALYEDLSKAFKEITKITGGDKAEHPGRLHSWTYAHLGLVTVRTPVWVRPDLIRKEEPRKEQGKEAEGSPREAKPVESAAAENDPTPPGTPPESEIQARLAEFMTATPQRRAQMQAEFEALPAEVRQRLMARFAAGGQPAAAPAVPASAPAPGTAASSPLKADAAEDLKWLRHSDERGGAGFVEWSSFDHPQLGQVEIGGFSPGFKLSAPAGEADRLAAEQATFIAAIIDKFPRLSVQGPTVTRVDDGGGVWRIAVRVVNDGFWPTRSAIGVKARRLPGGVLRLELPPERVVSGERVRRVPVIQGSGGSITQEWLVTGAAGESVTIRFSTPEFGEIVTPVVLKEAQP